MDNLTEAEDFKDCDDEATGETFQRNFEESVIVEDSEFSDASIEENFDDEYFDDYDFNHPLQFQNNVNRQQVSTKQYDYQTPDKVFQQYWNQINLDTYEKQGRKSKDKSDRATVEKALDPRTKKILFQLLQRNVISEIDGCICSGKEANVYYAKSEKSHFAVKVYKTSVLDFKDREKYIAGEFRNRTNRCHKNSRKMVIMWAEKEFKNLSRMHTNGLKVPKPIILKSNVLVMQFIGNGEIPARQLRHIILSESEARLFYREMIIVMRKMYQKCKLVHGDLSEYNILYQNGVLYIIDVSQSVEHNHPHSLEFLRRDCVNINKYFQKCGVAVMYLIDFFIFIIDSSIDDSNMEECLDKYSEKAANTDTMTPEEVIRERVFKEMYIPSRLTEVIDYERDIIKVQTGKTTEDDIIYRIIVGLKADLSGVIKRPEILNYRKSNKNSGSIAAKQKSEENSEKDDIKKADANGEEDTEDSSSDDDDDDKENVTSKPVSSRRPKHETLEEKKARKNAVKLAKAEKRKTKIKKHVKKRKTKLGKK